MNIAVGLQHRRYLKQKVRTGQFRSASDVVKYALDRLRKDDLDLAWLKREIGRGVNSLDRGEGRVWDVDHAKARLLRHFKRPGRKN